MEADFSEILPVLVSRSTSDPSPGRPHTCLQIGPRALGRGGSPGNPFAIPSCFGGRFTWPSLCISCVLWGGGSSGCPFVFPACFWSSSIQEGNTKDLAIPLYFLRGFDQPEPRRKYKGLGALKVGVIQEGNTKGLTSFWVVSPYNLQRKIGGRAPPKSKTYSSARPRGRAPPKSKTQVAYTTAHPGIWAALRNCCYKGHKGVQHCRKGLPLFDAANLAKISVWPPTSFHGSHGEELTWPPTDPDQIARLIKVPLKFGCNFDRGSRSFLVRIGGHQI